MRLMQIGRGFALKQLNARRAVVITDTTVEKLYGSSIDIPLFSFPAGEASKTREMKQFLEDQLLSHGFGRETCIIALGGGVVSDLAGFVASTFCRGAPLILIPTTLLAMVDAAIGGKTGVNTAHGKNLIGSFYPADEIWIDTLFLETLPHDERKNGMVEVIKYGLIASQELFDELLTGSLSDEEMIARSAAIKQEIVDQDPYEKKGVRRVLNFGHTLGHALEKLSDYTLPHGRAVAIGMLAAAEIGNQMGITPPSVRPKIEEIMARYGVSLRSPPISSEALMTTLKHDKKSASGEVRFVLLKQIGEVQPFDGAYCCPVPEEMIRCLLHQVV